MGNNYYLRTDSIGINGVDSSFFNQKLYIPAKDFKFDFKAYYTPQYTGSSTPSFSLQNYSTTPVSSGFSFLNQNSDNKGLSVYKTTISTALANVETLSQLEDNDNLSDASKKQIEKYLKQAEKMRTQAEQHSTSVVVLEALARMATDLDAEAAEFFASCESEIAEAQGSSDSDESESSTSKTEVKGDIKLSDEELQKRYGVKPAVTADIQASIANNVLDNAGSRNSFVTALSAISENNVLSFLVYLGQNGKINSFIDKIDGQNGWFDHDDERSIRDFLFKFEPAFKKLKDAGFLSKEKCEEYTTKINTLNEKFRHHFYDDDRRELVRYLEALAKEISVEVDGNRAAFGTEAHRKYLIKEKQNELTVKATKNFYKDYAKSTEKSKNPVTFDENLIYSLPKEVVYLPNAKKFQATFEDKKLQKKIKITGKDFNELNNNILNCGKEAVILKWIEIKDGLSGKTVVDAVVDVTKQLADPFMAVV